MSPEEKVALINSTKSPISFLSKLGQSIAISRKRNPKVLQCIIVSSAVPFPLALCFTVLLLCISSSYNATVGVNSCLPEITTYM